MGTCISILHLPSHILHSINHLIPTFESMSIKVEKLSKHFGEQKAVNEISFEANPGKILGFLGPNGAGKSTSMRMITGYLSPTGGDALVCGRSVLNDELAVKRLIGYLPENTPLYLDMYIKEFLAFVGETYQLKNLK